MSHLHPVDYEYYAQVRQENQKRILEVRPRAAAGITPAYWVLTVVVSIAMWCLLFGIGYAAYRLIRFMWGS